MSTWSDPESRDERISLAILLPSRVIEGDNCDIGDDGIELNVDDKYLVVRIHWSSTITKVS